jgi:methionyl aminopeptidase
MRAQEETQRIRLHGASAFEGMRKAGRLAAEVLDFITPHVVPGVSTGELDRLCHAYIVEHGAIPAPLNYRGFPRSICTSANEVVCHGIPSDRHKLRGGDIVNLDVTVILEGWHGDTSRMYPVGEVDAAGWRLMDLTYEAMQLGIAEVKPGATVGDIGHAIQSFVEPRGLSVVRHFCGHGIGKVFHDAPSILHFGKPGRGPVLKEGMFFTIEPMINAGDYEVDVLEDGWTAVSRDGSLSAQFEHTVGVSANGCEIFTLSPAGLHHPPYAGASRTA